MRKSCNANGGDWSRSSGPSKVPQLSHYAMIAQAESAHHGLFDIPLSEPVRAEFFFLSFIMPTLPNHPHLIAALAPPRRPLPPQRLLCHRQRAQVHRTNLHPPDDQHSVSARRLPDHAPHASHAARLPRRCTRRCPRANTSGRRNLQPPPHLHAGHAHARCAANVASAVRAESPKYRQSLWIDGGGRRAHPRGSR